MIEHVKTVDQPKDRAVIPVTTLAEVKKEPKADRVAPSELEKIRETFKKLPNAQQTSSVLPVSHVLELVALGILKPHIAAQISPKLAGASKKLEGSIFETIKGYVFRERWLKEINQARAEIQAAAGEQVKEVKLFFHDLTMYGTRVGPYLQALAQKNDEVIRAAVILLEQLAPVTFSPLADMQELGVLAQSFHWFEKVDSDEGIMRQFSIKAEALERVRPRGVEDARSTLHIVGQCMSEQAKFKDLSALVQEQRAEGHSAFYYNLLATLFCSTLSGAVVGGVLSLVLGEIFGSAVGWSAGAATTLFLGSRLIHYLVGALERLIYWPTTTENLTLNTWGLREKKLPNAVPQHVTPTILTPLQDARHWLPEAARESFDSLISVLEVALHHRNEPKISAATRTFLTLTLETVFKFKGTAAEIPESTAALLRQAFTKTKETLAELIYENTAKTEVDLLALELSASALLAAAGGMDDQMERPKLPASGTEFNDIPYYQI